MINRILIRIKVVQMVYSYLLSSNNMSKAEAKENLQKSLEKGYELYNYLLLLMVQLTELHEDRLIQAKNKYLPTEEDLHPNLKFVNNLFIKTLEENRTFQDYLNENPMTWVDDDIFMKLMLDRILKSDIYAEYLEVDGNNYEEDCRFWHNVMKDIILKDDDLSEVLESKSVYWNDDLLTVGSFVLKTIKLFEQKDESPMLPMFKNLDDSQFGDKLLTYAINDMDRCNEIIYGYLKPEHWDKDRVAVMDRLIMCVALAEVMHFPSIPARVTLNEYIEIAKFYSTPKSGQFINGILNSAINHLRDTKEINK